MNSHHPSTAPPPEDAAARRAPGGSAANTNSNTTEPTQAQAARKWINATAVRLAVMRWGRDRMGDLAMVMARHVENLERGRRWQS